MATFSAGIYSISVSYQGYVSDAIILNVSSVAFSVSILVHYLSLSFCSSSTFLDNSLISM